MNEKNQKKKDGNGITPLSKWREWKAFYFEPGRPGLEDGNSLIGLCKFCKFKKNCNIPKTASGIWHCSKYAPLPTRTV